MIYMYHASCLYIYIYIVHTHISILYSIKLMSCIWQGLPQEPLSAQTVPVKALRIPSSSTTHSRDASKASLGSRTEEPSGLWKIHS